MKKLFTLLTLLVAIVTGAQAADETYSFTGKSSSITNGYTANIGGAYVGRVGSNYTLDATNGLPTGNSKIFAAFKLNQKAKINTVFVWTKTNSDLSGKSISLVSLTEADYNQLVTAAGGETKYSNVAFTDNQTATVECLRANANVDFDVPFTNAVEAGYYAVYTASSVNGSAYIKRIEITYDSNPSDTRTNLVGAWTNDAPTFEYGEAATAPTFDVTGGTLGKDYSVAYSLTTDGGNVTVNSTSGITAIDTNTPGTSKVKATITVINTTDYKATTTEYETTITVNPEPGTEPITLFSVNATTTYNVPASTTETPYEDISSKATITGGAIYAHNGQDGAKSLVASNNSTSFYFSNNNTNFKIVLDEPLQAGDIITSKVGNSKNYGIKIYTTENLGGYGAEDETYDAIILNPNSSYGDGNAYTVKPSDTNLIGATTLYLYRATGKSTYFDEFTITRPVIDEDAPALTVAPDALSFTEAGNKTFTITGVNLTDGTYNITVPTGFTANPATYTVADGVVNQEVTVTYAPTANTPTTAGTITVTNGDNLEASVELTYYALVNPVAQTTVSEAKTWDIENDVTATKDVAAATETLYANLLDLTFAETFDATSLLVQAANAYRTGYKCVQDGTLKFTTTVPGTVTVTFASTGSNNTGRYLIVNGVQGEVEGATSGDHSVESFEVEAGDVTISRTSALRYYKVEFVPAVSTLTLTDAANSANGEAVAAVKGKTVNATVTRSLASDKYFGVFLPFALTAAQIQAAFGEGAVVAAFTGEVKNGKTFMFGKLNTDEGMEAYKGYLVKAGSSYAGNFTVEGVTIPTQVSAVGDATYAMVGTLDRYTYTEGSTIYYFTNAGTIKKLTSKGINGLRAFMADNSSAAAIVSSVVTNAGITYGGPGDGTGDSAYQAREVFGIDLEDDVVTGIESIENGQLTIDNDAPAYNLAGQKVGKGYKGIVIINGKKVVK